MGEDGGACTRSLYSTRLAEQCSCVPIEREAIVVQSVCLNAICKVGHQRKKPERLMVRAFLWTCEDGLSSDYIRKELPCKCFA
jgi:hypothetical protein